MLILILFFHYLGVFIFQPVEEEHYCITCVDFTVFIVFHHGLHHHSRLFISLLVAEKVHRIFSNTVFVNKGSAAKVSSATSVRTSAHVNIVHISGTEVTACQVT